MRVLLLLALLGSLAAGADVALDVKEKTLPNGLRILVHEDARIPNAALYVVWKVGSRNERPGITGLAHFFEHMMFMGGKKYGKRFDPVMEARGGSNNAYTSRDVTVYQDWFPADALPLILEMEADRMSGMLFRPETVETERGVVMSERRLNMEDPGEAMHEQLWAAAYTAHPYQWDVLGWPSDIEGWTKADLEAFFRRHYTPDHATLVVVGAVRADEVFRLAAERMGRIPRGDPREPIRTREPEQRGERRVQLRHPGAELPQVMMAWPICETAHADFPVHEVIEELLLAGESSRLHRLLVETEGACLDVTGGWQGYQFDPSLFTVELTLREGVDTARGEELVYGELARLAGEGPSERELRKAQNRIRAALVRQMKTIDGKASLLAETDTFFGGWRNLGERLRRVEAVTAGDVRRVAAATFTADHRTVCTLELPE